MEEQIDMYRNRRSILQAIIIASLLVVFNVAAFSQSTIEQVMCITAQRYQYSKVEFDIDIGAAFDNPFKAEEISVDMIITSPTKKSITLPCFYKSGSVPSVWKARFTPQEFGAFQYKTELRINGKLETSSLPDTLIIKPSAANGFLHKMGNNAFQFDSGKPFRGIGENIAWEGRSWENENYSYEYFLGSLRANGGNFFRTWMSAWNLPLEWQNVVDTKRYSSTTDYFHPEGIQRMDELLDLCDSLGVYMMLTLGWHGELQTGDRWNINVYNTTNGGPANTPADFFTSEAAKQKYKNRLRYIVARWGYSTSIAAWEFFNEIDNAVYNGTESQIAIPHRSVTQWHAEMSAFLKQLDPYSHLITTSISHREIDGLFEVSDLDFVQKHLYKTTSSIPDVIKSYGARLGKPFVVGEFGYDWDWNNINELNGKNLDFDYKRGLWYGLFSPTPILPLSWWWEFFHERNTDRYLKAVTMISEKVLLHGHGEIAPIGTTSSGNGFETLAVKCGSHYFLYLLNNTTSTATDRSVAVTVPDGNYLINTFDPETLKDSVSQNGTATGGKIVFDHLQFGPRQSIILMISPLGDTAGAQSAFGNILTIPGQIEAEAFDLGGESVAYHDFDSVNSGNGSRQDEAVDIASADGGEMYITNLVKGEWFEYSVNIEKEGLYEIAAKVAGDNTGRLLTISVDEIDSDGISFMNERINQNTWDTTTVLSVLPKGEHVLRINIDASDFNLDAFAFVLKNASPEIDLLSPANNTAFEPMDTVKIHGNSFDPDGTIQKIEIYGDGGLLAEIPQNSFEFSWMPSSGTHSIFILATDDKGLTKASATVTIEVKKSLIQSPFPDANTPHILPGKIEAEDFDSGDESVAYHDNTAGNIKGFYRMDTGPDIEQCTDDSGGFNLADIQSGEWVEYTVEMTATGNYNFVFRVSTMMDAQKFSFYIDDQLIAGQVAVPNTGSWQTWSDLSLDNVRLEQGVHTLRLSFLSEFFNLNYISVNEAAITSTTNESSKETVVFPNPSEREDVTIWLKREANEVTLFNAQGQKILSAEPDSLIMTFHQTLAPGVYFIKVFYQSGTSEVLKAIIK